MLAGLGVGAGGEPDVVRVAGQAGEDLLAVDHILVAVAFGTGGQGGQVGPRVGLGVADTEMDFALEDLGQEKLLLFGAAVAIEGGAHGVDREHGDGRARAHGLVEENELLDIRAPLTAEFFGPTDTQPTVGAHLADHGAVGLANPAPGLEGVANFRGEELRVVVAKLGPERFLLLGVGDMHDLSESAPATGGFEQAVLKRLFWTGV